MIRLKNLILLGLVLLFSCNNVKKEGEQTLEKAAVENLLRSINKEAVPTDHFIVILNVLATQADNFQLFYTEDYLLNFSEEQMITTSLQGSDTYQDVVFHLPKNVFPDRYRIDVGGNREQKELMIKSISFKYNKKEIYIPSHLISEYLVPNMYIEHDSIYNLYYLNTVVSGNDTLYDPYYTCSPKLVRLLMEL